MCNCGFVWHLLCMCVCALPTAPNKNIISTEKCDRFFLRCCCCWLSEHIKFRNCIKIKLLYSLVPFFSVPRNEQQNIYRILSALTIALKCTYIHFGNTDPVIRHFTRIKWTTHNSINSSFKYLVFLYWTF